MSASRGTNDANTGDQEQRADTPGGCIPGAIGGSCRRGGVPSRRRCIFGSGLHAASVWKCCLRGPQGDTRCAAPGGGLGPEAEAPGYFSALVTAAVPGRCTVIVSMATGPVSRSCLAFSAERATWSLPGHRSRHLPVDDSAWPGCLSQGKSSTRCTLGPSPGT
jgi:hypothetical protein